MTLFNNATIFIIAVSFLSVFANNPVFAQKAPDFSNEIMMGNKNYVFFMADRLEYNTNSEPNPLIWDTRGYYGNDTNKFWFESEGEVFTSREEGGMEFQGLYGRSISRYFDIQAGIQYDVIYDRMDTDARGFAVIGLQGLAPYFFKIESDIRISDEGDVSFVFEGEYDLPITQRLFGQPRIETSLAAQDVKAFGVESGFNKVQLGFRLRYEIKREFAPYIGVSWNRKLGDKADLVRADGEDVGIVSFVSGVRMWF